MRYRARELERLRARLAELALAQGLIVRALGDAIAFCPPLVITQAEMATLFERFELAFERLDAELAPVS